MEEFIQFIANYAGWQAVKKLKITPRTDPKTIMEFLASLTMSVDRKVEENLRKIISLDKIDSFLEQAETIEELKSRELSRLINSELEKIPDKNTKNEIEQFCRVYAARKLLKKQGIIFDYADIEIPALKKLKRIKK